MGSTKPKKEEQEHRKSNKRATYLPCSPSRRRRSIFSNPTVGMTARGWAAWVTRKLHAAALSNLSLGEWARQHEHHIALGSPNRSNGTHPASIPNAIESPRPSSDGDDECSLVRSVSNGDEGTSTNEGTRRSLPQQERRTGCKRWHIQSIPRRMYQVQTLPIDNRNRLIRPAWPSISLTTHQSKPRTFSPQQPQQAPC